MPFRGNLVAIQILLKASRETCKAVVGSCDFSGRNNFFLAVMGTHTMRFGEAWALSKCLVESILSNKLRAHNIASGKISQK